jgi:putative transposase
MAADAYGICRWSDVHMQLGRGASQRVVQLKGPFGLLDNLPSAVLDAAREWERHVMEVETGRPRGSEPGQAPRAEFDPAATTLMQRDEAKAAELQVSVRTVQLRRARYARQGLWGLVDQRAAREWEATGGVDVRLSRRSGR